MKIIYKITIFAIINCILITNANSQIDTNFKHIDLTFKDYLEMVSKNNLQLASERFNISIAEANIEIAKVFPNPSLSFEWDENREEQKRSGYGFSTELGTSIELGGKRAARIDLANTSHTLAKMQLNDYFQKLRVDATVLYLAALKQNQIFEVKHNSYETMKLLAQADSIRYSLGSITETDAIQSKLEADILFNDLLQAQAEWINSFNQLNPMIGISPKDSIFFPTGNLQLKNRDFNLAELVNSGKENRADILAIKLNKKISEKELTLAEKQRIIDIDLNLGFSNAYSVSGLSPLSTGLKAGISIPLKLSNIYSGETDIAKYKITQSELLLKQADIQVESEITQAYNQYQTYKKQTDNYQNGLLNRAKNVLQGKVYSYNRGETSLLEVLNAQRTYNEIRISYYESLYNFAVSLVELEHTSGIWDLNF